jgi:hypothetical protein
VSRGSGGPVEGEALITVRRASAQLSKNTPPSTTMTCPVMNALIELTR